MSLSNDLVCGLMICHSRTLNISIRPKKDDPLFSVERPYFEICAHIPFLLEICLILYFSISKFKNVSLI